MKCQSHLILIYLKILIRQTDGRNGSLWFISSGIFVVQTDKAP